MSPFWSEAALMTTSGLIVTALAVPIGMLAWFARPTGEPLLPPWKPRHVPWNGFELFFAFLMVTVLPSFAFQILNGSDFFRAVYGPDFPVPDAKDVSPARLEEAQTLRSLWTGLFALPLQLGLLWIGVRALHPSWKPELVGRGSFAGKIALAVIAWLVLTPVVLLVNVGANELANRLGVPPDKHPLTKFGGHAVLERALFVFRACAVAPLVEEVLFRGLLLTWCVGRTKIPGAGVSPVTGARPWFVIALALALALFLSEGRRGPVAFAGLLAVGLGVLWAVKRTGARRARAVHATAALFAVVHSNVWPSPIPLFLLALGLGWLAVRTHGVLVPVIVHGLFNAVSAVYVLRA